MRPKPVQCTKTPPSACPNCGTLLEAATGLGTPQPGSLSICYQCDALMIFSADLTLRLMTPEERAQLDKDPVALLMISLLRTATRRGRRRLR